MEVDLVAGHVPDQPGQFSRTVIDAEKVQDAPAVAEGRHGCLRHVDARADTPALGTHIEGR